MINFIVMGKPPFNYRNWLRVYASVVSNQKTLPNDEFRVAFVGIKSQVTFTFGEIKQYALAEIKGLTA